MSLVLKGDEVTPDLPLKDSEIKKLKQVIYWMCSKYHLHNYDDPQRTKDQWLNLLGCTEEELTPDQIEFIQYDIDLKQKVSHLDFITKKRSQCPKYLQAHLRYLQKLIQEHEEKTGIWVSLK